ncbi:MAG: RNA 2',3'-cyclic phosphodiesterase, partial [Oligoflexia bacterium]|nr:RNA 2',3'-cyclic phosphodiesterase [Oligoflexia bacterium]
EPVFREIAEALNDAFSDDSVKTQGLDLQLSGVGFFGSRQAPRVLWVGVEKSVALKKLYNKVENILRELRLPPSERKFSPHVTLARFTGEANGGHGGIGQWYRIGDFIEMYNLYRSSIFMVREFVLYSSKLTSKQSIYRKEVIYQLG